MNNFFDSLHCTGKTLCHVCRNRDQPKFRENMKALFVGITDVDFKCPLGVKWGTDRMTDSHKGSAPIIPEYMRSMGFQELADIILATGSKEGSELAAHERLAIESSGCTICRKTTASRLLRKWLVKNNYEPNRNG